MIFDRMKFVPREVMRTLFEWEELYHIRIEKEYGETHIIFSDAEIDRELSIFFKEWYLQYVSAFEKNTTPEKIKRYNEWKMNVNFSKKLH